MIKNSKSESSDLPVNYNFHSVKHIRHTDQFWPFPTGVSPSGRVVKTAKYPVIQNYKKLQKVFSSF